MTWRSRGTRKLSQYRGILAGECKSFGARLTHVDRSVSQSNHAQGAQTPAATVNMPYKECLLDEFWCMRLSLFRSGKARKRFMEAPRLILSEICLKSRICFNSYCGISRTFIFVLFPLLCAPSFLPASSGPPILDLPASSCRLARLLGPENFSLVRRWKPWSVTHPRAYM